MTAFGTTVVLPGRMFGPHVPMLWYAARAAEARGAIVRAVTWSLADDQPPLDPNERDVLLREEAGPALVDADLVLAKSLGCYAAALVADAAVPAVWFTPVLTDPAVVDGLRRATAPFLLVGGTADEMWDGPLARTLTPHVHEVSGGDHGLLVEGPLARSVEALAGTIEVLERFLDLLHG